MSFVTAQLAHIVKIYFSQHTKLSTLQRHVMFYKNHLAPRQNKLTAPAQQTWVNYNLNRIVINYSMITIVIASLNIQSHVTVTEAW